MNEMVPAQFKIGIGGLGDSLLKCMRSDCQWWESIGRESLTEVVALAREHVEEAHRDR